MSLDLWMGAEIEETVAEDYRLLSKQFEVRINHKLAGLSLSEVDKWTFVATILEPSTAKLYPSRAKFAKSRRTVEASVCIDHGSFLHGDQHQKIDLIAEALLQSTAPMERAKIAGQVLQQIRSAVLLSAEEIKASVSSKH